jgi:hypothetical protein
VAKLKFDFRRIRPPSPRSFPRARRRSWDRAHIAQTFAPWAEDDIIRYDVANVAVFAILTPDLLSTGNHASPHGCCRSLLDCLPWQRSLTFCCKLVIDLFSQALQMFGIHVTGQLGLYYPRMDRLQHAHLAHGAAGRKLPQIGYLPFSSAPPHRWPSSISMERRNCRLKPVPNSPTSLCPSFWANYLR